MLYSWQAGTNPVSFVHKAVLEYLLARNLNLDAVFDTFLGFLAPDLQYTQFILELHSAFVRALVYL